MRLFRSTYALLDVTQSLIPNFKAHSLPHTPNVRGLNILPIMVPFIDIPDAGTSDTTKTEIRS